MKNYIIILIVCLAFGACEKELDLYPKDQLSDATFWKTAKHFELAANEFYNKLPGNGLNDVWTDIMHNREFKSVSRGNYLPPNNDNFWKDRYKAIRNFNILIDKAGEGKLYEEVKRYVAEARMFRAYEYYRLYARYGGVPIVKIVLDTDSEDLYGARNSRDEVAKFILDDLDFAAKNLPKQSELASAEYGRATSGAAMSLRARVALFEATWKKYHNTSGDLTVDGLLDIAIAESSAVMSSGEYGLYKNADRLNESYKLLFIEVGDDCNEQIFARRYAKELKMHNFHSTVHSSSDRYITKALVDKYRCLDGLTINKSPMFQGYDTVDVEFGNRDPRMIQTVDMRVENIGENGTGYRPQKFRTEDPYSETWGRTYYNHKIIRYAEVLLVYAEATFEKNGSISDDDLNKSINLLRERAGIPATGYLTNALVINNSLNMLDEIRDERTIELAMEQFRYDDIRRWKIAEDVMPKDIKGIKFKGTKLESTDLEPKYQAYDSDGFVIVDKASDRIWENKHYLYPLPLNQLYLNDKLVQNPGWND